MNELDESQINEIFMYLPTERVLIKSVCRYWKFIYTKIQLRNFPSSKLILKHTDHLSLVSSLELTVCSDLKGLIFPNLKIFKLMSQKVKQDDILLFLSNHLFLKGLYLPRLDRCLLEHAEFIQQLSDLLPHMPNLEEFSYYGILKDQSIIFNSLANSKLKILRLCLGTNASRRIIGIASFAHLESLHLFISPVTTRDLEITLDQPFPHLKRLDLYLEVLSAHFTYKLKSKNFPVLSEIIVKTNSLPYFSIIDTKSPNQWPYLKLKIKDFEPEKMRELEPLNCIKQIEHLFLKKDEISLLTTCLLSLTYITKVRIELYHGHKWNDFDISLLQSGLKQLNHLTNLELSGLKNEQLFTENYPFNLTRLSLSLLMFKNTYHHITDFVLFNCPKLESLKLISALNDLTKVDLTKVNLPQLKKLYTFTHNYNEDNLFNLISYLPSLIWVYAFPKTLRPIVQAHLPHVYFSDKS